jgi:hypothetical protein
LTNYFGGGHGVAAGASQISTTNIGNGGILPRLSPKTFLVLTFAEENESVVLPIDGSAYGGSPLEIGDEVFVWVVGENEGDIYCNQGNVIPYISGAGLPGVASSGGPIHVVPGQTIHFVYGGFGGDPGNVWFSIVSA